MIFLSFKDNPPALIGGPVTSAQPALVKFCTLKITTVPGCVDQSHVKWPDPSLTLVSYNQFEIKKEQIHTQVVVNKISLEVAHLLSSYQYTFPELNFKISLAKIEEL